MTEAANVVPPDGGQPTPAPAATPEVPVGDIAPAVAAPAAEPAAQPAAEPAAQPAAEPSWLDGLSEGNRALAESRHWESADALATSYKNLESLRGVPENELIRIPKNDDAEGWANLQARLGRPAEAKDYELNLGDAVQQDFTDWMKGTMHKNGMTSQQAEGFANEWREFTEQRLTQVNADLEAKAEAEGQELERTWGAALEQNVNIAKQGAREFGLDGDMIDALEKAIGYKATMEFMYKVGTVASEAPFLTGEQGNSNPNFNQMTPAQAKQSWNDLQGDENFMKDLMTRDRPGHKAAVEKRSRLFQFIHPQ
jgi:hypothetical protein